MDNDWQSKHVLGNVSDIIVYFATDNILFGRWRSWQNIKYVQFRGLSTEILNILVWTT